MITSKQDNTYKHFCTQSSLLPEADKIKRQKVGNFSI